MIKLKNSFNKLVERARKQINQLEVKDAIKIPSNKMNLFIDIRDVRKIKKSGRILGAKRIPDSIQEFFNKSFNFIFYHTSSLFLAIAYLTANNIGLLDSSHLINRYDK